jgi:hypothetical protein
MNALPYQAPEQLARFGRLALLAGIAGTIVCAAGWAANPTQFYRSYLLAFLYWGGITLGCLGLLLIQYLTGGAWGVVIRRILEASTRTLPLIAIALVPVLLGLHSLYIWTNPEAVAHSELMQHKQAYLNVPFFCMRLVLYFLIWFGLVSLLNRWSHAQDISPDARWPRALTRLSGPGLVIYALTITFASVDWVMSLQPEWTSTIFGALIFGGQALASMAFILVVIIGLSKTQPMLGILTKRHYWDLGKMLFMFVFLWAYFEFSQLLITWMGNLPEETTWYLARWHSGWHWAALILILFHFALPFGLLLSRELKKHSGKLMAIALLILVLRLVDLFWMTAPAFSTGGIQIHWLDFAAPLALGGLWLALFFRQLQRYPLLPINDPHLEEALQHGKH